MERVLNYAVINYAFAMLYIPHCVYDAAAYAIFNLAFAAFVAIASEFPTEKSASKRKIGDVVGLSIEILKHSVIRKYNV